MRMQLNTKILVGFGVALVVLLLTASASLLSIYGLREQTEQVQHTYQVMQLADSLNTTLRDAQSGVRGYRLTYDTAFLRTYWRAEERLEQAQARIRKLTIDHPAQTQRLDSLHAIVEKEFQILRPLANSKKGFSTSDLLTTLTTDRLTMKASRQTFRRIKTEEMRLLTDRISRQDWLERATPIFVIVSAALAKGCRLDHFADTEGFCLHILRKDNMSKSFPQHLLPDCMLAKLFPTDLSALLDS